MSESGPFDRPTSQDVQRWARAVREGRIPRRKSTLTLAELGKAQSDD